MLVLNIIPIEILRSGGPQILIYGSIMMGPNCVTETYDAITVVELAKLERIPVKILL